MPKMPGGIPRMGGGFAKQGPPWRKTTEKVFNEACSMNRGQPSVFCYPDVKELLEGLSKASENGADFTGEMFLLDLHVVVEQLLSWPPAWKEVSQVLSSRYEWTRHYCDKILGESPIWYAAPLVRKSFITPRSTLAQIEKDTPHAFAAMSRWFDELGKNGDGQTKELLRALKENDKADIKTKEVHARPLMRLMMYEHSKALKFILGKACKNSKKAWEKFSRQDLNGLSILHHAASQGNAWAVEAILKSASKAKRKELAMMQDNYGYRALDWAALSAFNETVAALRRGAKALEEGDVEEAPEALKLFPAADADRSLGACSVDGACDGGWRELMEGLVPSEWVPDEPCAVDVIESSQFDVDVFHRHYMFHPRPLLIKGAGRPSNESAGNWTREGLLLQAGERKVEAELFPRAQGFDGSHPQKMTLREYVSSLESRTKDLTTARKKLHYAYLPLDVNEVYLNFSATLPEILDGKVEHMGSIFLLGGALMGAPPHHHGPALNSLAYGRKLWFLDPPGQEIVAHETMYDYLLRTKGAPTSRRCLQEAGDLLFVPRGWTHGALCLSRECVAVSLEISHQMFDLRD
eukprot:s2602_g1.t1